MTGYTRDPAGALVGIRGTNRSYYLFEGLGSVVAVTSASGSATNSYTYDLFGVTTETKARSPTCSTHGATPGSTTTPLLDAGTDQRRSADTPHRLTAPIILSPAAESKGERRFASVSQPAFWDARTANHFL